MILYHGAHRWQGPPEVRAAKSMKQIEHGPGFYLSTGIETAREYQKGGGVVLKVVVDEPITWLEDVWIDVDEMIAFVEGVPRLRKKKDIIADLRRSFLLTQRRNLPARNLVNLMHFHGALTGEPGLELVRFYLAHGIDADRVEHRGLRGDETWVVLYNVDKISSITQVKATR